MASIEQLKQELEDNIESLRKSVYPKTPIPDTKITEDLLLTDRQIAKNLIAIKTPDLDERSLNLIVYGRDLEKELGPDYKKGYSDNETLFPESLNTDIDSNFKPLPDDDPTFDRVDELKNEFRDSMQTLQGKLKVILSEITTTTIFVTNSIPTMSLLIAPPSFNVPGAISIAMIVAQALSSLKTQFREVLPFLDILKYVDVLIKEDKVESIINTLNKSIIAPIAEISEKLNSLGSLSKKAEEKREYLEQVDGQIKDIEKQIESLNTSASDYQVRLQTLETQKENLAKQAEQEIKK